MYPRTYQKYTSRFNVHINMSTKGGCLMRLEWETQTYLHWLYRLLRALCWVTVAINNMSLFALMLIYSDQYLQYIVKKDEMVTYNAKDVPNSDIIRIIIWHLLFLSIRERFQLVVLVFTFHNFPHHLTTSCTLNSQQKAKIFKNWLILPAQHHIANRHS